MAPTPEETVLYGGEDMVTSGDSRWVFNHPEVPKELGKVTGVTKFDAQFFRVHHKQAATMEPMSRLLLEHAYSAIYDAGLNPYVLRGKKVGVFIGSAFSESEKTVIYDCFTKKNGFGISGHYSNFCAYSAYIYCLFYRCNKAMYANRISYWLDAKGPSYTLDVACASSMACIDHAYRSIQSGLCEAAIVGGCNLCMHPYVSLNFKRAGFLCTDGKTKCFDKKGDGHVRSDAISVLFLQKAKDAKRIYSEVYHTKASYSSSPEPLLPVRDPQELQEFFEDFYSEIDVSPKDVEYVEANGAVGCVKSNMGSSEPASGACGLTKVCLAYHNGKLPGNLHYNEPLDIPAVKEDKIQVLTDNTNFNSGFAALNSLSYGGVSVHVLLKGSYKEKSSIPHLVLASGRHEGCLDLLMDTLKKKPVDPEQIGLLHNIHQHDIAGHMIRGYSILDTNENNETVCLSENIEYYPGTKRPVWFVYSGMGSQWATMGAKLMCIPVFAAAIHKCHKVLEPKGINIVQIITDPDKTIYDNILHSFVGIAAVQIGLTDVLTELGIVPDNIIANNQIFNLGHSVGELGCAYADGCFTAEEMILSAYNRGLVSVQTPFIRGSMAAVGLGYKAILPLCPPEIEVACHNSAESSTISGPIDIMKKFVSQLTGRGIFAKEVPCSNIAYHSSYIADAGPSLLKYLSKVIITPKLRSEKWVSTSVPQANWNEPEAKYSSAEYHTNNLLNPVLFEETSKLIPSDALVIEIAPHGLLQAILKRSLSRCVHVPLTKRGLSDPVKFLLEAIGKLFQEGLNPKVDILYPKIKYPVPEAQYNSRNRHITKIREFVMSFHDDDYAFLRGHVRDVRVLTHFRHHNIEQSDKTDMVTLSAEEVYTVMRLKGYSYKDEFQSIESSNSSRTKADIRWTENWITFLDAIFQFTAFARDYDGISTPSLIRKLTINVDKHKNEVKPISADGFTCDAEFHSVYKFTKCGGVEVDGLEFKDAPVIEQQQDNLLIRDFVPYFLTGQIEIKTALQTNMQLVFENITQNNIRVVDLLSKKSSRILELIKKTTLEIPSAELTIKSFGDEVGDIKMNDFEETDLLIIENLLGNEQKMKNINNFLNIGTFILALEQTAIENHPKYNFFNVITTFSVQNQVIFLLKKIDNSMGTNVTYLPIVEDRECSWINRMQEELTKSQKVVIVSEKQPYYNSMGMVQKLRKEYGNKIGLLIIEDYLAPSFYPTLSIYSEQLQKNLAFNVLKKKHFLCQCWKRTTNNYFIK
ncbi:Uncharacterized protein OBRU01_05235 [Operophtera brumata]|uniref:Ketosynthase family 3 (KS3) domain-containing protein n=1 Tax=Operophtera brumata TaxID=104452 RepID=A0A0L7LNK4_OPEBR|nr:Uncharacterized protein OBRU01_05235 [Operophtera brumata]